MLLMCCMSVRRSTSSGTDPLQASCTQDSSAL
jgi:hypothetical protein